VEGKVSFNGKTHCKNEIVTVSPGESVLFKSISDSVICVIKTPSIPLDKFINE
jgi:hypothetical protein